MLFRDIEEALPQLQSLVLGTQGNLNVIWHVSIFVSTPSSFSTTLSTHFMQLEKVIKQCRSDDAGKVKAMILKLIPNVNDIPAIDNDLSKHCRGFHHLATARLLCPASLRNHFDKGPKA